MESNSYKWNEGEMRRKAIKLVSRELFYTCICIYVFSPLCSQRVTHSVQTNLCHFKRADTTWVYLPKYMTSFLCPLFPFPTCAIVISSQTTFYKGLSLTNLPA